jgi:hypothetical protein
MGGSPLANPERAEPMMSALRKVKRETRHDDALAGEIKRIEALVTDLSEQLHDPDLPLSATMRLSICQNELLAYLRGIRFALGEEESTFELEEAEARKT